MGPSGTTCDNCPPPVPRAGKNQVSLRIEEGPRAGNHLLPVTEIIPVGVGDTYGFIFDSETTANEVDISVFLSVPRTDPDDLPKTYAVETPLSATNPASARIVYSEIGGPSGQVYGYAADSVLAGTVTVKEISATTMKGTFKLTLVEDDPWGPGNVAERHVTGSFYMTTDEDPPTGDCVVERKTGTWNIVETLDAVTAVGEGCSAGTDTVCAYDEYVAPACGNNLAGIPPHTLDCAKYNCESGSVDIDCIVLTIEIDGCTYTLQIRVQGTFSENSFDILLTDRSSSSCGDLCVSTTRYQGTWLRATGSCGPTVECGEDVAADDLIEKKAAAMQRRLHRQVVSMMLDHAQQAK